MKKYNQLVREIRNRDNYTYGDVTANHRKYVPQLAWKKKEKGTTQITKEHTRIEAFADASYRGEARVEVLLC